MVDTSRNDRLQLRLLEESDPLASEMGSIIEKLIGQEDPTKSKQYKSLRVLLQQIACTCKEYKLSIEESGSRIVIKDIQQQQVGLISAIEGNRIMILIDKDWERLMNFNQEINSAVILDAAPWGNDVRYIFHPDLTDNHAATLQKPIDPSKSKITVTP